MNGRGIALIIFAVLVTGGLIVAWYYGRRGQSSSEYWAAGGGITARRNALATVGDFLSGSSLLGGVGLLFLAGLDGGFYIVLPVIAWIPVMLLIAERMRHLGRFTMSDVLARRFESRGVRNSLAISTLVISSVYLLAQMLVMGNLFTLLSGVGFNIAVVIAGAVMIVYVVLGGMQATTIIQAAKAILLLGVLLLMTVFLLAHFNWNPAQLIADATAPVGNFDPLRPGNLLKNPWDIITVGLALTFGVAGLPHVMMRFFTVPNAVEARKSVTMTVWIIAVASVLICFVGLGAGALLRDETTELASTGGNLVTPRLAEVLGGGEGTLGGTVFLGVVSAVAFATVVAVVSGLLLNAASTIVRDLLPSKLAADGTPDSAREVVRGRIASAGVGVAIVLLAIGLGPNFNATQLVTLAFGIAASANFPALLLTLTWSRLTDTGAVIGILLGLVTSVVLMLLGPLWPGDSAVISLAGPTIVAMPLGFLGCLFGSLVTRRRESDSFELLLIESEVGAATQLPATDTTSTGKH
ncbi:cation acetate symporter [Rhodococcus ruber]|uniref:Cation acetate symporter n=1 Tax=Rhodococcus ruber TaxID=1830 RepID=A0ABT4MLR3_9NOCA|nr:cation acetate symporter [Rhodococcus ruber]MCZ4521748.1 cation acetate symporter [Rhodococcus ruber]